MAEYSFTATISEDSLTRDGKLMVAEAMLDKGSNFIGAALLLRSKGGYEHVVCHLLAQGIENVLKSILLLNDFDKYKKKIKDTYHHNLLKVANAVITLHGAKPLSGAMANQLTNLNYYYKKHLLRYGSIADLFVQPKKEDTQLVINLILRVVKIIKYRIQKGKYS